MPPHLGHLVWPRARESVPLKCFSLGLGSVLCQDSCWDLPRPAALALEVLAIYKAVLVPVKPPTPAPLALRFHWLVGALRGVRLLRIGSCAKALRAHACCFHICWEQGIFSCTSVCQFCCAVCAFLWVLCNFLL